MSRITQQNNHATSLPPFTPAIDRLVLRYGLVVAGVYGRIRRYCFDGGCCWASQGRIAKDLRLTRRAVNEAVAVLVKDGELIQHGRPGQKAAYTLPEPVTEAHKSEVIEESQPVTQAHRLNDKPVTPAHRFTAPLIDKGLIDKIPSSPDGEEQRVSPKTPDAVRVFRKITGRNPVKAWYSKLDRIVGSDPDDLEFWERVVFAYVGLGWNKTNTKTMLEFYERREIPNVKGKRKKRGEPAGFAGIRAAQAERTQ